MAIVLVPILPVLAIWATAQIAVGSGCMATPTLPCVVGGLSLGNVLGAFIVVALWSGTAFVVLAPLWMGLACWAIHRGWRRWSSRIFLSLFVAILLGYLPFVGPIVSLEGVRHDGCSLAESGAASCTLFGTTIGSVRELAVLPYAMIIVPGLTLLVWLGYVVIAIVQRVRRRGHAAPSGAS